MASGSLSAGSSGEVSIDFLLLAAKSVAAEMALSLSWRKRSSGRGRELQRGLVRRSLSVLLLPHKKEGHCICKPSYSKLCQLLMIGDEHSENKRTMNHSFTI